MKATYINHMGTDLSVVNAARVSFAKQHTEFKEDKDTRLIQYLARHGHWTPFGHTSITIHCKAPIFVARQLGKHQVGLVWNEVSRRYVDSDPEFYQPDAWRARAEDKKQGSSEATVELNQFDYTGCKFNEPAAWKNDLDEELASVSQYSFELYQALIRAGVCPEQARMVLPQSMYTEWYWTGNIAAFARVCNLRLAPDTQKETRDIARDIAGIIAPLFPVSWGALVCEDV